jgi:hypothetical protein
MCMLIYTARGVVWCIRAPSQTQLRLRLRTDFSSAVRSADFFLPVLTPTLIFSESPPAPELKAAYDYVVENYRAGDSVL